MSQLDPIALALQLVASGMSLLGMWFTGNKNKNGPVFALVAFVPWWALTFYSGLWGFVPVDLVMTGICVRNVIKWHREAA